MIFFLIPQSQTFFLWGLGEGGGLKEREEWFLIMKAPD